MNEHTAASLFLLLRGVNVSVAQPEHLIQKGQREPMWKLQMAEN